MDTYFSCKMQVAHQPPTNQSICFSLMWVLHEPRSQKLGNVFINAQQMVVELAAYLAFFLLL
jgi:hypothetical protein